MMSSFLDTSIFGKNSFGRIQSAQPRAGGCHCLTLRIYTFKSTNYKHKTLLHTSHVPGTQ